MPPTIAASFRPPTATAEARYQYSGSRRWRDGGVLLPSSGQSYNVLTNSIRRIQSGAKDIEFELRGIVFRWNAEKERTNIRKHDGVTFRQAAQVFFDPFAIGMDASGKGEARDPAIGADFDFHVLYVVHVVFEDDYIRMVSARKADPKERRRYEDDNA